MVGLSDFEGFEFWVIVRIWGSYFWDTCAETALTDFWLRIKYIYNIDLGYLVDLITFIRR